MSVTIKKVSSASELKKFIRFNYELYKENPFSVPDLYDDMLNTFSRDRNAAFEFCEADYFLAYQDGKLYRYCSSKLLKEHPYLLEQIEGLEDLKDSEWIMVILE